MAPSTASPAGSDSNNCLSAGAPCLTMNHVYALASAGDTVNVAAGNYASQTISGTAKTSAVNFTSNASACRSSCPVTLAGLSFQTSFVTLTNINVSGGCSAAPSNLANPPTSVTHNTFIGGHCLGWFIMGQDLLVQHSEVGPYDACVGGAGEDGVDIWQNNSGVASSRITFDDDWIHDVTDHGNECGTGTHIDGMQILAGHFITVTRSQFWNNATSDIIARPFNDTLDNLDFENNWLQEVVTPGAAMNLGNSTDAISGTNKVWYNVIESASIIFGAGGSVSIIGNVMATGSCQTGGTYDYNVFNPSWSATCGTHTKKAAPQYVGPTPSPMYLNGIQPNYSLKSVDTVAVGAGSPTSFPATDIFGTTRPQSGTSDAGAFELPNASQAATPTFSPVAGTYTSTQTVTISSTSGGAIICYNTTGGPATNSTTGCATGTLYAGPVTVNSTQTLFAVAGGTGFSDSTIGSAAYTINLTRPPAAAIGLIVSKNSADKVPFERYTRKVGN